MPAVLHRELAWLDALLHREVLRLRAVYALSVDEFRGIFISDEQVDAYLAQCGIAVAGPARDLPAAPLPEPGSAWATACERLRLSSAERQAVLLALAPELDRKYESLIAYLNNDIGRRCPTADLAARLFDHAPGMLDALDREGRLVTAGVLEPVPEAGGRRTLQAGAYAAAVPLTRFLLGMPPALPAGCAWLACDRGHGALPVPPVLEAITEACAAGAPCPALVLSGLPGCGRQRAAEAFAARLGRPLLTVDLARCDDPAVTLRQVALAAALHHAVVLLDGAGEPGRPDEPNRPDGPELPAGRQGAAPSRIATALAALAAAPGPLLLRLDAAAAAPELPPGLLAWRIDLPPPDAGSQQWLWQQALARAGIAAATDEARVLAERFRLGRAQIEGASQAAASAVALGVQAGLPLLLRAAREQSGAALKRLATAIVCRHGWDDLVLPPATIARVRGVSLAIAHRTRVQEDWGMARVAGSGGLVVLFHGPSGTGKTMSAGVIAAGLGLELYRVDLASVVSKYIGETEKNLDRIFTGARHSNAVLLFDEADALFGKRSEVRDAHDRYANVEVAYLLQRLEEHDGPVILATNFSRNMDQAFNRRLDQSVEFPRPDAAERARLWRRMLRPPLPLADGLEEELDWLGAVFELTGGEIRKAALEAAYLAAAGDKVVTLDILAAAAAQECRRQGRMVAPADSQPPALRGVA